MSRGRNTDEDPSRASGSGGGYPIVLTSSRAEMSNYGLDPFKAFVCTFPNRLFPPRKLERWFQPDSGEDGRARFALYGLRKVESILMDRFGKDNVICVHPDHLDRAIGPKTRAILISSMDPMGLAYVSTTYNSLIGFGGEALNAREFRRLMDEPAVRGSGATVVVGGEGAWQIKEAGAKKELGIDVLYNGEAERGLAPLVERILGEARVPPQVYGQRAKAADIRPIRNPSQFGMVEITRGCGRGCQFCSPTMRRRISLPLSHIMKEVDLNVSRGSKMAFLATEDFFLYKCHKGFEPNRRALDRLINGLGKVPGLEYIQISHAALAPAVRRPQILDDITPVLMERTRWTPEYFSDYGDRFVAVEVGVESGSTRLMERYMKGKACPLDIRDWPDIVRRGVGTFNDHGWRPLCTLMTGLPGETERDLRDTLDLVDDLRGSRSFLTPLLFIPIEYAKLGKESRSRLQDMTELQWQFISSCWDHNQRVWFPRPSGRLLFRAVDSLYHFYHLQVKPGIENGRRGKVLLRRLNDRFGDLLPSLVGRRAGGHCEAEACSGPRSGPDEEDWGGEFPAGRGGGDEDDGIAGR